MNLEVALKVMENNRVTHESSKPKGSWVTKCSCGYYHNSKGNTMTEEQFQEQLDYIRNHIPEINIDEGWLIVE